MAFQFHLHVVFICDWPHNSKMYCFHFSASSFSRSSHFVCCCGSCCIYTHKDWIEKLVGPSLSSLSENFKKKSILLVQFFLVWSFDRAKRQRWFFKIAKNGFLKPKTKNRMNWIESYWFDIFRMGRREMVNERWHLVATITQHNTLPSIASEWYFQAFRTKNEKAEKIELLKRNHSNLYCRKLYEPFER